MTGFTFDVSGNLSVFTDKQRVISRAATAGLREVAENVKRDSRSAIARAGFSSRWQAALRVDIYPKHGDSIDAAAFIHHNIPYAGVFNNGATISGHPYLWIPLPNTPKRIGRQKITPKLYNQQIGKLIFIHSATGRPLLAGRVSVRSRGKVTVAQLIKGQRDARRSQATSAFGGNSSRLKTTLVPLFVGVTAISIRGRFGLEAIFDNARASLAAAYFRNLRDD